MRTLREHFRRWTRTLKLMLLPAQTVPPAPPQWRTLYVAAVSETDDQRVPERIADAKKAMVFRARELFHGGDSQLQERSAIDDALVALHVLESSVPRWRTQAP